MQNLQDLEFRDELEHIFGEPMTIQNAQTPIMGLSIESSDKHVDSNVPQEAIESSGKNIGSNVPQKLLNPMMKNLILMMNLSLSPTLNQKRKEKHHKI